MPVQFLLCGDGAMHDHLKTLAEELKLTNFLILGFKNREGVREIMNVTDACFISYQHFPILETGSPNKYFDGLAAGKLIVVNFGGWIRKEIEANGCGIYVNPENPNDFCEKIRPFLEGKLKLEGFSKASRTLAEQKYSRTELSKKFAGLFNDY
jgi:glycosyltransferase involved in cell wall biosynthesis